jgi:hypothetical protein
MIVTKEMVLCRQTHAHTFKNSARSLTGGLWECVVGVQLEDRVQQRLLARVAADAQAAMPHVRHLQVQSLVWARGLRK